MRGKSLAIAGLLVASIVALAGLGRDVAALRVGFGVAVMAFPPLLIGMAVSRRGRVGGLRVPVVVLAVILQAAFAAMLGLSGDPDPESWWSGLPPATLVLLLGVWLVPLVLVGLAHAWWFPRDGLSEDDLRRLRDLGLRSRDPGAGDRRCR